MPSLLLFIFPTLWLMLMSVRTLPVMFGGLDLDILKSTLKKDQRPEDSPTYQRYWAATPEERRRKLLPFFWRLVTEQGPKPVLGGAEPETPDGEALRDLLPLLARPVRPRLGVDPALVRLPVGAS